MRQCAANHSPVMSWFNVVFGVQGASDVIGVIELSTAMMLIFGAFNAAASALGAAMSSVTFFITLSFFLTTPGVAEPTAGGFPAISQPIGLDPRVAWNGYGLFQFWR